MNTSKNTFIKSINEQYKYCTVQFTVGYHLHFRDLDYNSHSAYRFPDSIQICKKKKKSNIDIKHIYSDFLQNILLQLNTINKNQQPKEQLINNRLTNIKHFGQLVLF